MSTPINEYPGDSDRKVIQGFGRPQLRSDESGQSHCREGEGRPFRKGVHRECIPRVATVEDDGAKTCFEHRIHVPGTQRFPRQRSSANALAKKPELQAFVKGAVDRAGLVGESGCKRSAGHGKTGSG